MIAKFAGGFSILLGILWVIWPQILRGWAVNKTSGMIFWPVFFAFFFPLASWAGKLLPNGWIWAVVVFFVVGNLLKRSIGRAAEKIPLYFFRSAGFANIASGLALIFIQ